MKKYAFYLPQFHEIPENDRWWGKGFTEWTNVKKALPLYNGHQQPQLPLNDNYYSLDNVETLFWQADLAKKYQIDGMIFYHYYFCGKKLLEKPAEMLMGNKNIPMNFFFCWANHSWYRSWEGSKELLIEQVYGTEKDWEEHFQYLLPFFKDERYIKRNNKPLFIIFKADFKEKNEYFEYLEKRCKNVGFAGLCGIEILESYDSNKIEKFKTNVSKTTEFIHLREPASMLSNYVENKKYIFNRLVNGLGKVVKGRNQYLVKYSGKNMYNLASKKILDDKCIIRGLCLKWDNSPRHSYRGYVITPPSKEEFMKYMSSIKDNEFLFINAWNEWCEGMMLEPTKKDKYKYLEWLKEWSDIYENRIDGI